jgi:hypothetical protein
MLIPIYVGNSYSAALNEMGTRQVQCEKCSDVYFYHVLRQGSGHGFSPIGLNNQAALANAVTSAAVNLQHNLMTAVEPVPCPRCGWLQADMVFLVRSRKYAWMTVPIHVIALAFAIALLILASIYGGSNAPVFAVAGSLGGGVALACSLLYARGRLQARYDPNWRFPKRPPKFKGAPSALRLVNWPPDPSDENWLPKFERVEA